VKGKKQGTGFGVQERDMRIPVDALNPEPRPLLSSAFLAGLDSPIFLL